jgi:chromosome segregation protein
VHLKSVQVLGFKTFAKKTELLFEPGITAVVGPNGSGKSNLVDAIRWVLGERSARELRGSRMEEIVYSGGARRAASGLAEVRLLIDNGDGRLPVPFAEVEVIRRGYRSGESDYSMNGSRCRLRDIEELFASTGLTQQGYAVVAQDDVDHIIQTSAAERRALIEEAAGVRGLRSKRHEAMAKLGEADVSILRLGDVAAELGPRVEELRRQAEAARLQRDVTSQLEALRGSLLQGEWRQARQAVKKATARVETLSTAAASAEAEALAFAADYEAHKEKLAGAHDARLQRERRMGALRLAATHAGAKVELLAERLASTRLGVSQAEAALADARLRLQGLEAEVVAAREDAAAAADPGHDQTPAEAPGDSPGDLNVAAAAEREQAARAAVEALREAHQEAAARVHRLEERVSLLRRLAMDGDIPTPSARRLVELLAIPAVREAAVASGVDPATIAQWAEEGRLEQTALAAAGAAAGAELEGARAGAAAAEAQGRAAVEAAADSARDLEGARSTHLEELAEHRALMGRAAALRGRLERCILLVERQREEVGNHEKRLEVVRAGVAARGRRGRDPHPGPGGDGEGTPRSPGGAGASKGGPVERRQPADRRLCDPRRPHRAYGRVGRGPG